MQETFSSKPEERQDPKPVKKKLDMKNFLTKGTYIDAKDSMSNWCVANIIEVCNDDDTIRVKFDGWGNRWNEWYKFTSSKIAPFRKFSKGSFFLLIFFFLHLF